MKKETIIVIFAALVCLLVISYDTVNAGWFGPRKDSEPKPRPNSAITSEKVPGCFTLTVGSPQYKHVGETWHKIAAFYNFDSSPQKMWHFHKVNKAYSHKGDAFYILMKGDRVNIPDPDLGYDFTAQKPGQLMAGFPKAGDCAEKRAALIAKAPSPQNAPKKCVPDKDMEIAELRALMADLIKKVDSLQTASTAPEECVEAEEEVAENLVRTVEVSPKNDIEIHMDNDLDTIEIRNADRQYNTVQIHQVPSDRVIIKGPDRVRISGHTPRRRSLE